MRPHLVITQADLDAAADGARQIQDALECERRRKPWPYWLVCAACWLVAVIVIIGANT